MKRLASALSLLLLVVSCNKSDSSMQSAKPVELNVLAWSEYIPPEIIDNFQEETHIKVNAPALKPPEPDLHGVVHKHAGGAGKP